MSLEELTELQNRQERQGLENRRTAAQLAEALTGLTAAVGALQAAPTPPAAIAAPPTPSAPAAPGIQAAQAWLGAPAAPTPQAALAALAIPSAQSAAAESTAAPAQRLFKAPPACALADPEPPAYTGGTAAAPNPWASYCPTGGAAAAGLLALPPAPVSSAPQLPQPAAPRAPTGPPLPLLSTVERRNLLYTEVPERTDVHRRPGFKVWVGDLPLWANLEEVSKWAHRFTGCTDIWWNDKPPAPRTADPATYRSTCWCIVTFATAEQATGFLQFLTDWHYVEHDHSRWLVVRYCKWLR